MFSICSIKAENLSFTHLNHHLRQY